MKVKAFLLLIVFLCATAYSQYSFNPKFKIRSDKFRRQHFFDESPVPTDASEEAADLLLSSMNFDIHPCDNFYQFACGRHEEKVRASQPLHIWHNTWKSAQGRFTKKLLHLLDNLEQNNTSVPKVFNKLKIFYNSCLARTDNSSLEKSLIDISMVVADLGGTSFLNRHWQPKYRSVFIPIFQLAALFGIQKILTFYVDLDSRDPGKNVIYLSFDETLGRYIGEWGALAIKLYANLRGISISDSWFQNQTQEMYNFVDAALNVTEYVANSGLRKEPVKYMTLQQFRDVDQELADQLKWSFNANPSVQIHTNDYDLAVLRNLKPLWKTHHRAVQNLVISSFMEFITVMLNLTDGDVQWDRLIKNSGYDDEDMLKKMFCILQIGHPEMKIMDFAAARLFIDNYGPYEDELLDVRVIFENVREQFKEMLMELPWLDYNSKTRALNKVTSIVPRFGYPPWLMNDTLFENYYKSLEGMKDGDSFVRSLKNIFTFKFYKQVSELKEPVDPNHNSFESNPLGPNAFYHRLRNALLVNLAFLQPPIYMANYPTALNYAILGSLLGHELTHGFDQNGIKYNRFGKSEQWMSNDAFEIYNASTDCFIRQFSSFCYVLPNGQHKCVNGTLTVQENMADQGGLASSYRAFKVQQYLDKNSNSRKLPGALSRLSWEQTFFLAYAVSWCEYQDPQLLERQLNWNKHPPNQARINGALQNFPEFSQAFGCPFGNTKMNPTCKCKVW